MLKTLVEKAVELHRKKGFLDEFPNLLLEGSSIHPSYKMQVIWHPDYIFVTVSTQTNDPVLMFEGANKEGVLRKILEQLQRLLPVIDIPKNI